MSPKQKKLASKAPPPNKIDEKDFAVLRAEKAKGRGMGLQDEKVQPGKVQKAVFGKIIKGVGRGVKRILGGSRKTSTANPGNVMVSGSGRGMGSMLPELLQKAIDDGVVKPASKGRMMKARKGKSAMVPLKKGYSKTLGVFPTINKVKPSVGGSGMGKGTDKVSTKKAEDFMKRRKQLSGAGKIGKMLLPVVGAGVAAQQYLKSKMKKKDEPKKKMGGGMMKKYSKGGGADSGRIGEMKSRLAVLGDRIKKRRDTGRLTLRDKEFIRERMTPKSKMGGGMIAPSQKPGYSKGTMVKARGCKLGRTRPTKIT